MDRTGEIFKGLMQRFLQGKEKFKARSFGPDSQKLYEDVQTYIVGLEFWVSGNMEWCFESGRYFGSEGKEIKRSRVISL